MSCASYLGIGHRIEFFGEDGTLVLHNPGADYMRGFELFHAQRPAAALERVAVSDPADAQYPDGRIAPVSRLAKRFFDAIESGGTATPGFAEGYRVQRLMDAARRSHNQGAWIDFAGEDHGERSVSNARILVTGGSGFIGRLGGPCARGCVRVSTTIRAAVRAEGQATERAANSSW